MIGKFVKFVLVVLPLIVKNKDIIIKYSNKYKPLGILQKGLPYIVEWEETIVNNLKSFRK